MEFASKWFKKAALVGFPDAQYNLGVMYENGEFVKQDLYSLWMEDCRHHWVAEICIFLTLFIFCLGNPKKSKYEEKIQISLQRSLIAHTDFSKL